MCVSVLVFQRGRERERELKGEVGRLSNVIFVIADFFFNYLADN